MKKTFVSAAFFYAVILMLGLGSFSSCKKSDVLARPSASAYYMRFKLNGVQKEYPISGAIVDTMTSGYHSASIAGSDITGTEACGFTLFSNRTITTGSSFTPAFIPGTYLAAGDLSFIQTAGQTNTYDCGNRNSIAHPVASIVITELTATYAKGIFSGDLYDVDDFTTVKYRITDGEFYAVRQY